MLATVFQDGSGCARTILRKLSSATAFVRYFAEQGKDPWTASDWDVAAWVRSHSDKSKTGGIRALEGLQWLHRCTGSRPHPNSSIA